MVNLSCETDILVHTSATLHACVRAMRPVEKNRFQGRGGAESVCGRVMESKVENGLTNRS